MVATKKRVLVIGGSFAGLRAARDLRHSSVDVTVIDSRGFFEYTPGILRTLVEGGKAKDLVFEHQKHVRTGTVESLQSSANGDGSIATAAVLTTGEVVPFDYAIVCAGSSYSAPFKPCLTQKMSVQERINELESAEHKVQAASRLVVVGGGSTGVELAAELAGRYGAAKAVTLVCSQPRLLPHLLPAVSEYCHTWLEKRGVTVVLGERLNRDDPALGGDTYWGPTTTLLTDAGRRIHADVVFWASGIGHLGAVLGAAGAVPVSPTLLADGYTNVFCAGDCARSEEPKTAVVAHLSAGLAAANVLRMVKAKGGPVKLLQFPRDACGTEHVGVIECVSLYKHDGVLQVQSLVVKGRMAAAAKGMVESMMVRLERGGFGAVLMAKISEAQTIFLLRWLRPPSKITASNNKVAPESLSSKAN